MKNIDEGVWQTGDDNFSVWHGCLIDTKPALSNVGVAIRRLDYVFYLASSCPNDVLMLDGFAKYLVQSAQYQVPKAYTKRWFKRVFRTNNKEYFIAVKQGRGTGRFDTRLLRLFYSFQTYVERYNKSAMFRIAEWINRLK